MISKFLAHSCLGLIDLPDGMTCNPAMTPLAPEPHLAISGLLSNGYATIQKTQQLLSGKIDLPLIQDLFSRDQVLQAEGAADIYFKSRILAASYTPLSVKFYSASRNEANPDVEMIGVKEEIFSVQSGTEYFKPLYLGLRIRSIKRDFIKKRVKLLDLLADTTLAKPSVQRLLFVEPAATLFFPSIGWRPRLSMMVENVGTKEGDVSTLENPESLVVNFTLSPMLWWGILDLSMEYRSLSFEEAAAEKLHLALGYRFGIMYAGFGVDYDGVSGGLYYEFDKLNAGISYSTNQVPWRSRDFYFQTVYVQAGWHL